MKMRVERDEPWRTFKGNEGPPDFLFRDENGKLVLSAYIGNGGLHLSLPWQRGGLNISPERMLLMLKNPKEVRRFWRQLKKEANGSANGSSIRVK